MTPASGERLREGLLQLAESQGDQGTIATLAGRAGLAAEKAGDLQTAVGCWRRAIAAGSTNDQVADRFTIWLVKQHAYLEAAAVLRQALAATPRSAEVADRLQRRLARCERSIAE
jgi:Tfp pilus assembly protein PilF